MLLQKLQQWLVLPPTFCRNCKNYLIVGFRKTSIGWWWWWRGLFGWGVEGYIQWNLIGIVGLWGFILFEQMFPRLVNSVRPPALDADSLWVGPKHRCTSPPPLPLPIINSVHNWFSPVFLLIGLSWMSMYYKSCSYPCETQKISWFLGFPSLS